MLTNGMVMAICSLPVPTQPIYAIVNRLPIVYRLSIVCCVRISKCNFMLPLTDAEVNTLKSVRSSLNSIAISINLMD